MLVLLATQRQGLVLNFRLRMFDALHEVASKCKRKALSLNSTRLNYRLCQLYHIGGVPGWLHTCHITASTHMLRT